MVFFWQLSGPDSHFSRDWTSGDHIGNAKIALQVARSMSRKLEDGRQIVDLVLGIETSGASHILVPEGARKSLQNLNWRHKTPYPASKFASLSPIYVDRNTLQTLLEDRQVVSKSKAAGKKRGDNSKANQVFYGDSPPRSERAAFEHGRCFWRVLHQELHPETYGLPDAPWSRRGLDIISIAMNFWSADRITFLDAGITRFRVPSGAGPREAEEYTWYFKSKDCEVLRNSSKEIGADIPMDWNTCEVESNDKADIGMKIQRILEAHYHPISPRQTPLVLLTHDFAVLKESLISLGVQTSTWKHELKELLGFHMLQKHCQELNASKHSRARSCSPPPAKPSAGLASRHARSPLPVQSYAPIYVVDTMMMFKAVTAMGNNSNTIRPVEVFNKLTSNNEPDGSCGGRDSNYIMQSWKAMVAGPSIVEQKDFYMNSSAALPARYSSGPSAIAEPTEDAGLHQVDELYDPFNDGSDSDAG